MSKTKIKSGDAVLIKASRGMHFEEVYNTIKINNERKRIKKWN
mgnify:CR=1 FL=1